MPIIQYMQGRQNQIDQMPNQYQIIAQFADKLAEDLRQREMKSRLNQLITKDLVEESYEVDPGGKLKPVYKRKEQKAYPYTREEKIEFEGIKSKKSKSNIQRMMDGEMPIPQGYRIGYGSKGQAILEKEGKPKKKEYLFTIPPGEMDKPGWFTGKATVEKAREKARKGERLDSAEATLLVMQNIKTKEDLEELIEKSEEYARQGVDVQKIIDYYTQKE
jgi:hypothetical protein